ncbi:MAG TPA: TonB-dependent receptor [Bryobacteraceae bacterium]|nr:TonB-dependent receptor [Bryobacteraceae bacterium]
MNRSHFLIPLLLLLSASSLLSQVTTASIVGTVKDASGAAVPAAAVKARATATNLTREVESDNDGNYSLTNLPVGMYEVSVAAKGFKTEVNQGLELQVAQRARLDVTLQAGAITESVNVTAEVPIINTEDSVFGDVIDNKRVVELPLNGRNFNNLALLTPNIQNGVPGGATLQGFLAGGIAVWAHGNRDTDNEWNLDGATMNVGFYNWNSFNPSIDGIQEFKMQTGAFSAEFGFQAGANINIVTKSGTNSLHGTAFNFLRNDKMDARGFFPTSKPKLRQNQFGGTIGGPVIIPKLYDGHNRTFFFSNYEGIRIRQEQFGRYTLPTDAQRAGDLSLTAAGAPNTTPVIDPLTGTAFPGNQIPANRIPAQSQAILKYFPRVNTPGQIFNYQILAPVITDSDSTIQRIDHRFSDKDYFFARGAYDNRYRPDAEFFPGFKRTTTLKAYNIVAGHTRIWSPAIVQESRLAYNRSYITQSDPRENTNFSIEKELGIAGIPAAGRTNGFPFIAIAGYSSVGDFTNNPLIQPDDVWQLTTNFTITRRRHTIKVGFDGRKIRSDRTQGLTVRGQFNFENNNPVGSSNSFGDFLLGRPQQSSLGNRAYTVRMRNTRLGMFIQDDWRVSSRLTLNVGLRYEPTTPIHDARGEVTGFDFTNGQPIPMKAGDPFYPKDWNNFAPRFGFAWRPFASDKTVIRGGFGIYYNYSMGLALTRTASNPPWAVLTNYFANAGSPLISWDNPFPAASAGAPPPPNYAGFVDNFGAGYSQLRSLHLSHQLTNHDAIEIGYAGNLALGGDRAVNANDAPPGPGAIQARRRWPQYGVVSQIRSDAKTFYNSGTAKYTRRFSDGLTVLSSYTFSRTLDQAFSSIAGNPTGGAVSQTINNLSQRGLSASHRKHVWVTSAVYQLPFGKGMRFLNHGGASDLILGGWQLSSILTVQSGGAFAVTVQGANARLNTGSDQRPNRIRDGNLSSDQRSINRWFDTDAFVLAPMYTFGSEETRTLIMPGLANVDVNLKKAFPIYERVKLEFRAEFFNFLNHTNFSQPGSTLGTPQFGIISSSGPARVSQMSLKLVF